MKNIYHHLLLLNSNIQYTNKQYLFQYIEIKHSHRYQVLGLDCIFFEGIISQPAISSMSYPSLPLEQKMVTTSSTGDDVEKPDHSYMYHSKVVQPL